MDIKSLPEEKILYFRRTGEYGEGNYAAMARIKEYASSHGLMGDDTVILGIAQDNPQTTPPEQCRYDTCVVTEQQPLDADISAGVFTGGKYAVFTVEHTAAAVAKAWLEIFIELAHAGVSADNTKPIVERYAAEVMKRGFCEICVPIV